MKRFLLKAISPRPTFAKDMTEEERGTMKRHVGYWTDKTNKGIAIVFGPVLDPKGVWGVAVIEVEDDANLSSLLLNDPASELLTYEVYPMAPGTIVRK
jgi:hypothetical protein